MSDSAEEKKRKRLEAWRRKQQQQPQSAANEQTSAVPLQIAPVTRVALSLSFSSHAPKSNITAGKTSRPKVSAPAADSFFDADDEDSADENQLRPMRPLLDLQQAEDSEVQQPSPPTKKRRKGARWDQKVLEDNNQSAGNEPDALDQFMDQLQSGTNIVRTQELNINVSGSMIVPTSTTGSSAGILVTDGPKYTPNDWMSDTGSATEDDEDEEEARRRLIDALKVAPPPPSLALAPVSEETFDNRPIQLAAEVKSEKLRREHQLKQLEMEAQTARQGSEQAFTFGRLYNDDGDIMEEAERTLQVLQQAPDALTVLAELNKKKEIQSVDHSKIDYPPLAKNLYRVPRSLACLTSDEVINRRAKLQIKVRGQGTPAPVSTFEECGLSDKILQMLKEQGITQPYPVQAQCIPCIMAGRDVIGIAKTGSGKTLAYLLPMLRHILAQPPLAPNESGPIGLVLAPARELAFQIFSVCKQLAKPLGLK
jgi:hypothetical protein